MIVVFHSVRFPLFAGGVTLFLLLLLGVFLSVVSCFACVSGGGREEGEEVNCTGESYILACPRAARGTCCVDGCTITVRQYPPPPPSPPPLANERSDWASAISPWEQCFAPPPPAGMHGQWCKF